MRPVDKGPDSGPFAEWVMARDPLLGRIGRFCSYCEKPLDVPDIEHKEPKSLMKYADGALDWNNFLLACGYCNSNKLARDPRVQGFLFPDEVNTACVFEYKDSGFIGLSGFTKNSVHKSVAESTRDDFLKLNRIIDTKGNRDLRWQHRLDVWREAKLRQIDLLACNTEEMRRCIVSCALGWSCFSVWMTVFAADADMCFRFITAFPGTRIPCFDAVTGVPINDLTL